MAIDFDKLKAAAKKKDEAMETVAKADFAKVKPLVTVPAAKTPAANAIQTTENGVGIGVSPAKTPLFGAKYQKIPTSPSYNPDTTLALAPINTNEKTQDTAAYVVGRGALGAVKATKGFINEVGYLGQGAAQGAYAVAASENKMRDAGKQTPSAVTTNMEASADKLAKAPLTNLVNFGQGFENNLNAQAFEKGYDKDKTLQTIASVSEGVGGMIPSIISNVIVPGSSLFVMATGAAGNATEEAVARGADTGSALAYGAVIGITEAATEKLFNGVAGVFGKGAADDVLKSLVKRVSKDETTQKAIMALANTLGEGFEEWLTEYAEAYANKAIINQDSRTLGQISDDALYSGLIGSLTSLVMQGANVSTLSGTEAGNMAADNAIPSTNVTPTAQTGANNVQLNVPNMQNSVVNSTLVDNQTNAKADVDTNVNALVPNFGKTTQNTAQDTPQSPTVNESAKEVKLPTNEENAAEAKQSAPETKYGEYGQFNPDSDSTPERVLAQLYKNGVDASPEIYQGNSKTPILSAAIDVSDYVRQETISAESAGKALAEAYKANKGTINSVVERAMEIDGKDMPEWYRKQYHPTEEESTKQAESDKRYWKGIEDYKAQLAKIQAKKPSTISTSNPLVANATKGMPQGTGAMSNPFVPEQKTSKVFTNTFQKTDSLTDAQKAQMKPEDYQYDVRGKAINEAASQQRVDNDYEGEVADLYSKSQWTDEDVYTSKKILDKISAKAETSGDYTELNKWTKAIQKRGTSGGKTIEAFKAFQNTPEGAVIKAQQVIAEAEKKITKKKELGKDVDNVKGRKIKSDTDNTKKVVKESANESANSTDPANVAVEWWIRDTSIKLSQKIDANSKDKGAKANIDTTMQTMLKDLVRITQNAAPQGDVTKIKTNLATNTLRNYWANSEQYQSAIERAQRYINEKYANNPEALAVFNDWLSGNGINTWKTLGKALQENGVKYNDILMSNWQDKAKLLDEVTSKILADTDLTESEAKSAAQAISDKFYDELAIRAQKKIEQLLKPSTPKQQKTMYQRINEFINSGVFDDSAITTLVNAKYGIPSLTAADVQKIYELNKLAQETDSDYQRRVYLNKAAKIIADKLPVTGKDKVLAVRRIAMLLNPKTLISRNAGGNVIFGLLDDIKDMPGTLIDLAVSAKTGQRTTSYNPLATAKAEAQGFKKGIVEWGKDIKNKVDTSPTQHEMPQAPALKSAVGKSFESALNKLLQLGDRPFYELAYAKRIDELKRLGRDYTSDDAIAEANIYALERVFQNNSTLAKKAMEMRDSLGVIGDIAIPFAQTPANIFDKLADYSPYGYVRAIKKAGTIKDSAWSQKQFVDTLARSMTGTGILAFAFFAAKSGLITGGDNKEEDEALTYQNKISGWQPYSIVVGDKSYTYDWSTVVGALLSLGADISQSENAGDTLLAILSNGAKAGINTMFNQSYMEGVAELFGSSTNGKADIGKGLESMLVSLPASFTPTAFQQIAKIIDPIARDTYDTDPLKKAWNKVKAKLPFLSQTLPAKIGASGQPMTNYQGSKLSNILESTLSPGFIGETQKTAIDTEVQRLYKATGDKAVLTDWSEYTSKSDLSFTVSGKEYTMTTREWEQYQKTRGQYAYKELNKLTQSASYKSMSDAEKAKAVSSIVAYSNDMAKREFVGSSYVSNDYQKVYEAERQGISPSSYFTYKAILGTIAPDGSATQLEKTQAIEQMDISVKQKGAMWQLQNSTSSGEKNPYTGTLAQAGLAPEKTIAIMAAYDKIDKSIDENYVKPEGGAGAAQVKAAYLNQWLASQGYNSAQISYITDVFTTWQMIPIDKPSSKATAFATANPMP